MYEAARADGFLAACSDPAYLNDKVDKLCQALRESTLWDAIHNSQRYHLSDIFLSQSRGRLSNL
jgi:hypothetical protein